MGETSEGNSEVTETETDVFDSILDNLKLIQKIYSDFTSKMGSHLKHELVTETSANGVQETRVPKRNLSESDNKKILDLMKSTTSNTSITIATVRKAVQSLQSENKNTLTKIANEIKNEILKIENTRMKPTYASVTTEAPSEKEEALIIHTEDSNKTIKEIGKNINPQKKNIMLFRRPICTKSNKTIITHFKTAED